MAIATRLNTSYNNLRQRQVSSRALTVPELAAADERRSASWHPAPPDRSSDGNVRRSASTGRFVSKATANHWPGKTITERVGSGTGNSTTVHRSASTGRFVTESTANRNLGGTISQRV